MSADGLYRKYIVERVDGSTAPGGKHENCRYFVLDLDHDPHARGALWEYASACSGTHPALAADLRELAGELHRKAHPEPLEERIGKLREAAAGAYDDQPDAGASPAHVDPDNLAHILTRRPRYAAKPGMLLGAAGRVWRVTHPGQRSPFPDTWLPVLSDAATAGVLLEWLALEADGVGCERLRTDGGAPRWCVTAHRAGELRAAEHEDLGVAVALVLLALGGAL